MSFSVGDSFAMGISLSFESRCLDEATEFVNCILALVGQNLNLLSMQKHGFEMNRSFFVLILF